MTQQILITGLSAILALVCGIIVGVVVEKINQPKKIVTWSVISESKMLSLTEPQSFGNIKILVNNTSVNKAFIVALNLGNTGNSNIKEPIRLNINFGALSETYSYVIKHESQAFKENVKVDLKNPVLVILPYLKKSESLELTFIVGNYEEGGVNLDMAHPDIFVKKLDLVSTASLLDYIIETSPPINKAVLSIARNIIRNF